MIEMIDLCINMQKRVIDAHEQSIAAMRQSLKSTDATVEMHKAMEDATRANISAWNKWLSVWGWRK
tara:strand:+ start:48498 stop:48695 length:198 start_codon:yes stop_codon:yes gene_type:complete